MQLVVIGIKEDLPGRPVSRYKGSGNEERKGIPRLHSWVAGRKMETGPTWAGLPPAGVVWLWQGCVGGPSRGQCSV